MGTAPDTTDLVAAGASLFLAITEEGTTKGGFTNPITTTERTTWPDASLDGTWTRGAGDTVFLKHEVNSPVRGLPLVLSAGRLEGAGVVDGVPVRVVLLQEQEGTGGDRTAP